MTSTIKRDLFHVFSNLTAGTDSARKEAAFLKETANSVATRPRSLQLSDTTESLKDLVKERQNPGKKLMKLGAAMLILPDPVTDAAGVPLLITGKILSSRETANLKSVYEELRDSLTLLSSSL